MKTAKLNLILLEGAMIAVVAVFLFPIFLIAYNSLKPYSEIMKDVIALPQALALENYSFVWSDIHYPALFLNNVIVTAVGLVGILVVGSLAGYKLSRTKSKLSTAVFLLCIAPMIIPFQTTMITLLKLASTAGLTNSVWGLAVQYWGFGAPFAIFLFHGYMKSIPVEMDESAVVDGASPIQVFVKVIFPLLQPMTFTVLVIDAMWIWNDFLLPLIMVNPSKENRTLTLAVYSFFGQYVTSWQYAMAALVLAVLPSILFFVLMQRHIIKGVTAGAVKG